MNEEQWCSLRSSDRWRDDAIDMVNGLSPWELRLLRDNVLERIRIRETGIHYAESRRSNIAVMGVALVAAGIALLRIMLEDDKKFPPTRSGGTAFAAGFTLTGLTILCMYSLQTNYPYPFVPVIENRTWYYNNALAPHAESLMPDWNLLHRTRKERKERAFTGHRPIFYTVQIELLSDPKKSTIEDIGQLLVLHVNQAYKHAFLRQLRTVLVWGVTISVLVGSITFIVKAIMQN